MGLFDGQRYHRKKVDVETDEAVGSGQNLSRLLQSSYHVTYPYKYGYPVGNQDDDIHNQQVVQLQVIVFFYCGSDEQCKERKDDDSRENDLPFMFKGKINMLVFGAVTVKEGHSRH
jgi:hypothetical protein